MNPRELARDFTTFCDGVETAGMSAYAQVGRVVADELVRALNDLDAERSARVSAQERAERWETIARSWERQSRGAAA